MVLDEGLCFLLSLSVSCLVSALQQKDKRLNQYKEGLTISYLTCLAYVPLPSDK